MLLTGDSEKEVRLVCSSWNVDFYIGIEKAKEYIEKNQAAVVNEKTVIFTYCGYSTRNIKVYIKDEILKRDENKCVCCGGAAEIIRRKVHVLDGGKADSISNGFACCGSCDAEIKKEESTRLNIRSTDHSLRAEKELIKEKRIKEIKELIEEYKKKEKILKPTIKLKDFISQNSKYYGILYCDASVKNNITTLANVIVKDGKVIYHKVTTINEKMDNNRAELLAVQKGIKILKERDFRNVQVLTDSGAVVSKLTNNPKKTKDTVVTSIQKLRSMLDLEIGWIPRSKNKIADSLTKGKRLILN